MMDDDNEMLAQMGTDGAKWAAEFRRIAQGLGYSDMDEGWLIGWFANAIEAGRGPSRMRDEIEELWSLADDCREWAKQQMAYEVPTVTATRIEFQRLADKLDEIAKRLAARMPT